MSTNKVFYYIFDPKLVLISKNIPNIGNRAAVVQSLIASYGLLHKHEIYACEEATDENLLTFHSADYIDCIKEIQLSPDLEKTADSDEVINFNLGYDCPLFDKLYDFVKLIAGSSLTAAKLLVSDKIQFKQKSTFKSICLEPKSYLRLRKDSTITKIRNECKAAESFIFDEDKNLENNENHEECYEKSIVITKHENEDILILDSKIQPIAINWFGGWHHAQRDEAGGFCYVNDIVIAIQYLLKYFKRILYIDLDCHHGNGVENAFLFSPRVFTLSFHQFETGFYPLTGSLDNIGKGNGTYYNVNVPLKSGITDERYVKLFKEIVPKILEKYNPLCFVIQCGADCLPGDPIGGFNITSKGLGKCLKIILDKKLPTLILGGGGYNISRTSRCWAYLTSIILDRAISNDIPDHSFLHLYGPEFELSIPQSLRKDENSDDYLQHVLTTILGNLDMLPES